jgi:hypothetical protein
LGAQGSTPPRLSKGPVTEKERALARDFASTFETTLPPYECPTSRTGPSMVRHHVGDGVRVRGDSPKRVGGGDHAVVTTDVQQCVDHAIPARRLGERAVNKHDRGKHQWSL